MERQRGKNDGFRREETGGFAIHRPATELTAKLVAGLLPDPDRLFATGEIYKPGSRTHAGKIVVAGHACFLKRFNCRGWWYVLRHLLKPPRASRTWAIHCEMFRRGLPVPEPFACLIEKRFGLLRRSYILSAFADGFHPLHKAWPSLQEEEKQTLLRMSGDLLGRMHREGIVHRDCKWSNLLVRWVGDAPEFMLVDFDGSRLLPAPSPKMARRDIDRFLRDLKKAEGNLAKANLLLDGWSRRMQEPLVNEAGSPAVLP